WEIYTPVTQVDDQTIQFMLYDTRGQEDYDRARPIYYRKTDVYIITYAIDSPDSLDNVFEKWVPEVQHFAKGAPYVLVGMKKELRVNERTIEDLKRVGQQPVTTAEGLAMSRRIGAAGYFECSNVTREGIHELFEAVGSVALRYRKSRRMSSVWYSISKAFKNMKNQAGSNAP
ncbi:ras-domain-containing protein, partial [Thozetella sp. PMI_491]